MLNRGVLRNPDLIFPGMVLALPDRGSEAPPPRLHVVARGETLSGIALDELGEANRWPEIFDLNRAIVSNPDVIFPDQVLLLPT